MNEREYKIGNLQLQLGSLKDELKDTNKAVEERHTERDSLLKEIEVLRNEKKEVEKSLSSLKNKFATIESGHTKALRDLELMNDQRQQEADSITRFLIKLKDRKSRLNSEIKELKKELGNYGHIEVLKKEVLQVKKELDELREAQKEAQKEVRQYEFIKSEIDKAEQKLNQIIQDQKNARKEVKEIKSKAIPYLESAKALEKDWYRKNKDLQIVEGRLKRKWKVLNPNIPFPKV